jgi:hypothetical protein
MTYDACLQYVFDSLDRLITEAEGETDPSNPPPPRQ